MTLDDAGLLLGIFSDPIAMQYYESTRDFEQTLGWIRWNLGMYEEFGHGMWAAFERDNGRFVGQIGLVVQEVEGEREIELGYLLLRSCWGRGYATGAAERDHLPDWRGSRSASMPPDRRQSCRQRP